MTEAREEVAVRLSSTLLDRIDRMAETDHRSRSDMIRVLLFEAITARRRKAGARWVHNDHERRWELVEGDEPADGGIADLALAMIHEHGPEAEMLFVRGMSIRLPDEAFEVSARAERDRYLDEAVRVGKIEEARRSDWERKWDADPRRVRALMDNVKPPA